MGLQELERDGWILACPFCGKDIRYTLINNQQIPVPFFYAENGNDVLLRKQDELKVEEVFRDAQGATPNIDLLERLWLRILEDTPEAPCGGKYGLWANVKCPNCTREIPYNDGIRNISRRVNEPKIVLVDGAVLVRDSVESSWRVKVKIKTNT